MAEQPTNLIDYELQRLAHIRRNHEFLGLARVGRRRRRPRRGHENRQQEEAQQAESAAPPKIAPPPESLRRSRA